MPTPYSGTVEQNSIIAEGINARIDWDLRNKESFRNFFTIKSPDSSLYPASDMRFYFDSDIVISDTPLDEYANPAGQSLPNPTFVTVTPRRYGDYSILTDFAAARMWDGSFEERSVNKFAYAIGRLDNKLIGKSIAQGTYNIGVAANGDLTEGTKTSLTGGTAANGIISTDSISLAVERLRDRYVAPTGPDGTYLGVVTNKVARDLRKQFGPGDWRAPQNYINDNGIRLAHVGVYEGVAFFELSDADLVKYGSGSATKYPTLIFGDEALANYEKLAPQVVTTGTIMDPLDQFTPIGAKMDTGYGIYRDKAVETILTQSNTPPVA